MIPLLNKHYRSPNYNARPDNVAITHIILHYTDTTSVHETFAILMDPARAVSAHYVLDTCGTIYELVSPENRAWHAGVSMWCGIPHVNDYSIGIEIQNGGHAHFRDHGVLPPYPDQQIECLITLLKYLCAHYQISPQNIIAHSDIAPERKLDPGEHFPWGLLGENGLGIWPAPEFDIENILLAQYALKDIGYNIPTHGQMDDQTWSAIDSFKRHFYPKLL